LGMSNNVILLFPNRGDEASLSNGLWQASAPIDNLQTRFLRQYARSFDLALSSTKFDIALTRSRAIKGIVLVNHNLTLDAQYRITASDNSGFSGLEYDSGWLDVWPSLYSTLSLSWSDPNWWSGKPLEEDIEGFTWSLIQIPDTSIQARYWRIEIDDQNNPAGYVQIGRLFMSGQWQPSINYSYGASIVFETNTVIDEAQSGQEFFDRREPYRVLRFALDYLPESEGFPRVLDMQRKAGLDKEIFVIARPDDTENMLRLSFLGRLLEINPLEMVAYGMVGTGYAIKEFK
jgi:hypothetical protein